MHLPQVTTTTLLLGCLFSQAHAVPLMPLNASETRDERIFGIQDAYHEGCWKDSYGRWIGSPCRPGYDGSGFVCWQTHCPIELPVRCGAVCMRPGYTCALRLLNSAQQGISSIVSGILGDPFGTISGIAGLATGFTSYPSCLKVEAINTDPPYDEEQKEEDEKTMDSDELNMADGKDDAKKIDESKDVPKDDEWKDLSEDDEWKDMSDENVWKDLSEDDEWKDVPKNDEWKDLSEDDEWKDLSDENVWKDMLEDDTSTDS